MPLGKHSNKATKARICSDQLQVFYLDWLFESLTSSLQTLFTPIMIDVTCVYTFLGAGWPSPKLQARVNAGPVSVPSFRTFTAWTVTAWNGCAFGGICWKDLAHLRGGAMKTNGCSDCRLEKKTSVKGRHLSMGFLWSRLKTINLLGSPYFWRCVIASTNKIKLKLS